MSEIHDAGLDAARNGQRRSSNPHPVETVAWSVWMDAFDAETVRRDRAIAARDEGQAKD